MSFANWPIYAMFGGATGVAVGLLALVATLFWKRPNLRVAAFALVVLSAFTTALSFSSTFWKKPDCYLSNGELDESREECRLFPATSSSRIADEALAWGSGQLDVVVFVR